ncbi:MAG: nuclear transport factor 2 family protein [Novosphingobium sp.]
MSDEEAIRATIMGYNVAGDSRDAEKYLALFAEDAVLEYAGFGPTPAFRTQGRAEIAARIAGWNPAPGRDPSLTATSFIRHNLTTSEIELTGPDTARARTYFVVMTELGPDHAGVYSDELVKRDGQWLFQHRRITLDWRAHDSLFPPVPRVPGAVPPDPRQANVDLMNRYARALDTRDWDLLTSILTEDASLHAREWGENAQAGEFTINMEGREGMLATLQYIWSGLSRTHHMLSNYVVDPAPDLRSARASCYMRAHHVGNRERSHLFEESLGRFDFETVLEDGRWKIRRMEENIMVMLGTADAFPPAP